LFLAVVTQCEIAALEIVNGVSVLVGGHYIEDNEMRCGTDGRGIRRLGREQRGQQGCQKPANLHGEPL
jgi:hypothetical protein